MATLSDITFISIERPSNAVTEIHGYDIDTKRQIKLKAAKSQDEVYYIIDPKTKEKIIIQTVKVEPNKIDSLFVYDKDNPTQNLLIEMEKRLTGEPL